MGEELAISIGMDLDTYWNITPKQFDKYVDVYMKKEEERAKEMDYNNYNLGKYIAYAFHNPKKYPSKPFLQEHSDANREMTPEEMDKRVRDLTIKLGGTINE